MLKSLVLIFCGAVMASGAILVPLAAPAWCAEPNWVLLDENEDSRFYYDKGASKDPGADTVQARTRVVYTEAGKADALKILDDKKFNKLFESRYLHDINCKKEESRLLEASHLDKEGVTLKSTDLASATEWEEIPPYARLGLVLEKVCPQNPAQK